MSTAPGQQIEIDFPGGERPLFVSRMGDAKINFVTREGTGGSIELSAETDGEATVLVRIGGAAPVEIARGPAAPVALAFGAFATRATAPASVSASTPVPPAARPAQGVYAVMLGAIVTVGLGLTGGGIWYAASSMERQHTRANAAEIQKFIDEKMATQLGPAMGRPPGMGGAAPAMLPEMAPLALPGAATPNVRTVPVRKASDAPASPTPGPGAVAVPKDLPTIPSEQSTEQPPVDAGKNADASANPAEAKKDKAPAMTPDEAQQLLLRLEKVKNEVGDGKELTPELLKQLPFDIAKRLVGTGIATIPADERRDAARRQAKIVRLPPEIINKYRGRDGIASVPEADTWVANGGYISIPLPGGGDISSPDILKEFGLEP